ncbi:MAG: ABC transporter permease [Pseudonocardiales bacterium]|nr:ABC transporter permease [Pseudonocardiales bacterium]MBV9029583.1 ABC transporter permease [Pseudonocardiales bacterium]
MSEAGTSEPGRRRIPLLDAWRDRARAAVSQLAAAGAVIVLFGYLSFASGAFLSASNLFNIGVQSAVMAIIAIGMTMVVITAGIDLSVGSVAALSGVLGAMMVVNHGVGVPLATVVGAAIGAIAGAVNGLLVTRAGMAPFIATLGMLSVARGLVYIVTGSVAVSGAPPEFMLLGQGKLGALPIPILALVGVALAGHLILTRTRLGRYAYAMGSNVEAAWLSGIPVKRYLTIVYIISGTLAGFGGMIAASRVDSGQPNFGIGLELDVIAATVIGGASLLGGEGKVIGTLLGALLIALVRNGSVLLDINVFYQQVIIGVIIWIAVFWDRHRRRVASEPTQA